jgi:glycosyltransferase involved in cell wall biosynthesis
VPPYRRLSVVVPAYNEADTISAVLTQVKAVDLSPLGLEREIVVVDDCSTDATASVLGRDHPDVVLLHHQVNHGKGRAIRTALGHASGDLVLIQDADLEYAPADHPALLQPFFSDGAQVVFGSRFLRRPYPRGMRISHFTANKLLTALANGLYGLHLTDEATCYKVFDARLLRSLPLMANRFDFCPEVTSLLALRGVPIVEVPVEYQARDPAHGKKIRWVDGVSAVRTLLQERVRLR